MRAVTMKSLPSRFADKVDILDDDCWLWTASKCKSGYGKLGVNGRTVSAHRYSWEHFNGGIPEGLWVLHRCDVRSCVNPEHLFLGTHRDNMVDMVAKARSTKGELHGISKLTQSQVDEIRKTYIRGSSGEFSQEGIAQKYGVCRTLIGLIVNFKIWI